MLDSPVTQDAILGGRVRLLQTAKGHRVGTDAVLLAAAAPVSAGDLVIDVGAATGAVGLMVAARSEIRLVFVERDAALADLCRRNIELNGADGRVALADVLDRRSRQEAGLSREGADLVVTNPPFLEEGQSRPSPDPGRAAAHVLPDGGLAAWLQACAGLIRPKGRLALIHRADRITACLDLVGRCFGGIRLRLVHPEAGKPASRLLLTGVKGSRAPLVIAPPLFLHDGSGRFTPEAEALHRGETILE
jgi:tRNA1(Val) A37 N6-methylase TrmN6